MQGDKAAIRLLNRVLRHYLITINQYFLHGRMLKNWGYRNLGGQIYKQSIAEMKFADKLIERVLFLEGIPNLQDLGKLYIGENVIEAIACDLKAEYEKFSTITDSILELENLEDYVSRDLLEKLKFENEEYIDWLETQQEHIAELGLENYLQLAM